MLAKDKESCGWVLSALLLTACGGGGGGGSTPSVVIPAPTNISGTVTPPVAPSSGPVSITADVRTPANSSETWPAIVQRMNYTFDTALAAATPSVLKATTLSISAVDTQSNSTFTIATGAGYPTDLALGRTVQMMNVVGGATSYDASTATGALVLQTTSMAGLPTVTLVSATPVVVAGYVLPYSATLNPAGYTYQTFGSWVTVNGTPAVFNEYYFSAGAPTVTALPVLGTASYTGAAAGSLIDAATREPSTTIATMNATVDFAARTVAFSTTGTTSLSDNAAAGTLPTADSGLNMSGTLSYAAGNNTFTGAVTTTNGMSGNATGRFYGPGIAVATPTKAVGAPPEIGGTFAVMSAGTGAMQGAFGGK